MSEEKVPFHEFFAKRIKLLSSEYNEDVGSTEFSRRIVPILEEVEIPDESKPLVADAILCYISDFGSETAISDLSDPQVETVLDFLVEAHKELLKKVNISEHGEITLVSESAEEKEAEA